ncbi:BQ2448_6421 [Microbotryum intermedium]|uniref:BQ2448_6421 protein n=1 Tax=Microbotryum intermedium TaxID=269621 RepID=A0A238FP62_9BASI|nr:BQ2448_6421 [Microbotryum intermedium]
MTRNKIPIAFDVLGTCFCFDPTIEALWRMFPDKLISEAHARSVVDDWFHSSQRDFTYLSMNGGYTPIAQILKATLPRVLQMNQITTTTLTQDDLSSVLSILPTLPPRPTLVKCSALLLASENPSFQLMAATNGADKTTKELYRVALGEEEAGKWMYFSCDEIQVAKPAPIVYEAVWERLRSQGLGKKGAWFVASHTWDLYAAKKAGFKTSWTSYEEHDLISDVWGRPDVIGTDLVDIAKQIIAWETKKGPELKV